MTSRNVSRRFSPSVPSGTHIAIAAASVALGVIVGISAASQPFQSWGRSDSPPVAAIPQTSTNIQPGSGVDNSAVQPSSAERKLSPTGVNGFKDFDPAVTYDR